MLCFQFHVTHLKIALVLFPVGIESFVPVFYKTKGHIFFSVNRKKVLTYPERNLHIEMIYFELFY